MLAAARLPAADLVSLRLAPGDAVLFAPYVVHGSGPNCAGGERRIMIINLQTAVGSPQRRDGATS